MDRGCEAPSKPYKEESASGLRHTEFGCFQQQRHAWSVSGPDVVFQHVEVLTNPRLHLTLLIARQVWHIFHEESRILESLAESACPAEEVQRDRAVTVVHRVKPRRLAVCRCDARR